MKKIILICSVFLFGCANYAVTQDGYELAKNKCKDMGGLYTVFQDGSYVSAKCKDGTKLTFWIKNSE